MTSNNSQWSNRKDWQWINNKKWYYRLKPKNNKDGLFSEYTRSSLINHLIVCWNYKKPENRKSYRLYTAFDDYVEFARFYIKIQHKDRTFYEIILGERGQKPHFDIDIEDPLVDGDKVRDALISAIISVLADKNIIGCLEDFCVFTSHSNNNNNSKNYKRSYHIVLNKWYHANNIEAKAFYLDVIERVHPQYHAYIDPKVYSPTQAFRMPASTKRDKNRFKILHTEWTYTNNNNNTNNETKNQEQQVKFRFPEEPEDSNHQLAMTLETGLVGFVNNCKSLPAFTLPETIHQYEEADDVTPEEAKAALNLVAKVGKVTVNSKRFPYKLMEIEGPFVTLKRIKPSCCKICKRIHEHENPYLLIIGEERSVYFCCRRSADNKKLFLGNLNDKDPNNSTINSNENNTEAHELVKNWSSDVISRLQNLAQENEGIKHIKRPVNETTLVNPIHSKKMFKTLYKVHY